MSQPPSRPPESFRPDQRPPFAHFPFQQNSLLVNQFRPPAPGRVDFPFRPQRLDATSSTLLVIGPQPTPGGSPGPPPSFNQPSGPGSPRSMPTASDPSPRMAAQRPVIPPPSHGTSPTTAEGGRVRAQLENLSMDQQQAAAAAGCLEFLRRAGFSKAAEMLNHEIQLRDGKAKDHAIERAVDELGAKGHNLSSYSKIYLNLISWVLNSPDSLKMELTEFAFVVLIEIWIQLATRRTLDDSAANEFLFLFCKHHEVHHEPAIRELMSIRHPTLLSESKLVQRLLRGDRANLTLSRFGHSLLLNHLVVTRSTLLLEIFQRRLCLSVVGGSVGDGVQRRPASLLGEEDLDAEWVEEDKGRLRRVPVRILWGLLPEELKPQDGTDLRKSDALREICEEAGVAVRLDGEPTDSAESPAPEACIPRHVVSNRLADLTMRYISSRTDLSNGKAPSSLCYTYHNNPHEISSHVFETATGRCSVTAVGCRDSSIVVTNSAVSDVAMAFTRLVQPRASLAAASEAEGGEGLSERTLGRLLEGRREADQEFGSDPTNRSLADRFRKIILGSVVDVGHLAQETPLEVAYDWALEATAFADESGETPGGYSIIHGHDGSVTSLGFILTGNDPSRLSSQILLSGGADGMIRLWGFPTISGGELNVRCKSPICVACIPAHESAVWSIDTLSPFGGYFVTGSGDRSARLWALGRSFPLRIFADLSNDVEAVAIHPNTSIVAAGVGDGVIRLFDVRSAAPIVTLQGHSQAVGGIKFSPSGALMASWSASGVDSGTALLWDLRRTPKVAESFAGSDSITSMAFANGSTQMAMARTSQFVQIVDITELSFLGLNPSRLIDSSMKPKIITGYRLKSSTPLQINYSQTNILQVAAAGPV